MSTEKMRKEFEAWLLEIDLRRDRQGLTPLNGREVRLLEQGWIASRASLVVELPAIEAWDNDGRLDRERDDDADERMGLIPRVDTRDALVAAGITVKE